MSNDVESNDGFKSNAQQQAESKVQQAVAEASTALVAEQERTQRLESQNQIEYVGSCLATRPLRGSFDVLLRVKAMFSRILWTVKHGIGGLLRLLPCPSHQFCPVSSYAQSMGVGFVV